MSIKKELIVQIGLPLIRLIEPDTKASTLLWAYRDPEIIIFIVFNGKR